MAVWGSFRMALCFIFAVFFSVVEAAGTMNYSFPGNISSDLLLVGRAQNLSDLLIMRPSAESNGSQVVYYKSICNESSSLSFSTTFVFRLSTFDIMGFSVLGVMGPSLCTDPNSCDALVLVFNSDTDQVSLSFSSNKPSSPSVNSTVSLSKNLTLQAWIDYHPPLHPNLLRLWVAVNGTSRPSSPLFEYNAALMDGFSYVFPGFIGCFDSPSNSSCMQTIYSWSFSVSQLHQPTHGHSKAWIAAPIILSVCLAGIFALYVMIRVRRHQRMVRAARKHVLEASNPLVSYSYKELRYMTRNFKEVIGKGGSCTVYKGKIETSQTSFVEVAVKDMTNSECAAEHQFMDELRVISRVRHQNLVTLKGWCHEDEKLLLVYEYMPNGSLDKLLFTTSSSEHGRRYLSWSQRLDIIKSVAEGLVYLHEGLERRVIHRDIKAANVLLDEKMKAKLGDFGLARLMTNTIGDQTMTRAGTMGYMSPELAYTGRATEKSDVYSFGVLVLEIVAGRRSIDYRHAEVDDGSVVLLGMVWKKQQRDELSQVFDPRMMVEDDDLDIEQAEEVLKLGLHCCSLDPADRPTMKMCCKVLCGDSSLPPLGTQQPPHSLFGIAESSSFSWDSAPFTNSEGLLTNTAQR